MSTPMTPTEWKTAIKRAGLSGATKYRSGWEKAGRDAATGKPFGPVHGVVIHHTAGTNSLALVATGRPDLPGPLAHAHLDKSGVITMLSAHRTNHVGTVARNAYDAMLNESHTHPTPAKSEPIDGNDSTYGIEIENRGDGKDPYPSVQYDNAARWAAGICLHHGWTADSVVGHKELTTRKIDPSFSMTAFRTLVAKYLGQWR